MKQEAAGEQASRRKIRARVQEIGYASAIGPGLNDLRPGLWSDCGLWS
jgi:hypothetical protein